MMDERRMNMIAARAAAGSILILDDSKPAPIVIHGGMIDRVHESRYDLKPLIEATKYRAAGSKSTSDDREDELAFGNRKERRASKAADRSRKKRIARLKRYGLDEHGFPTRFEQITAASE